jgi:acyl-CoA synthetase (AMP-forming)/AMP-acid ligase II
LSPLIHDRTRNQHRSFQTDISTGKSVTYTCLLEQTDAVASSLRNKGLQTGDVVLIMAANHVEVAVFFFAVWKAGACNACLTLNLLTGDAVCCPVDGNVTNVWLCQTIFAPERRKLVPNSF